MQDRNKFIDLTIGAQEAVAKLYYALRKIEEQEKRNDVKHGDVPGHKVDKAFAGFARFLDLDCPHPPKGMGAMTWREMGNGGANGGRVKTLRWMLTAPQVSAADRFRAAFLLTVVFGIGEQPLVDAPANAQGLRAVSDGPVASRPWAKERCPFLAGDWAWVAKGSRNGGRHRALRAYEANHEAGDREIMKRLRLCIAEIEARG